MLDSVAARLLPAHCLLCAARSVTGLAICPDCHRDLPRLQQQCPRCALPMQGRCGRCLSQPPTQAAAWAAYRYAPPLDRLLPRLKFAGDLAVARGLGEALLRETCPFAPGAFDALIPAPLHPSRLRARGFNQALELARPFARQLGAPLRPDGLRRLRPTTPQTGLHARERQRNVRHAFASPMDLCGMSLLLFDDVCTTGATWEAMARALYRAGARRVSVACVARATTPQ